MPSLSEPRLSNIIEGVEATLELYGRSVRVVVTAETLQDELQATSEPASWLATFEAHAALVERAAKRAHAKTGHNTVIVRSL